MISFRKAGWFFVLALAMAGWMGAIASLRGEAVAGVIASHGVEVPSARAGDLDKVQRLLETKVVAQMLMDYGVAREEAMAKVRSLSDRDLHRLASLADRTAEGADSGLGILIGLAILVILVIVILKLMNKQVIVR